MRNRVVLASLVVVCLLAAISCGEDEVVALPPVVEAPDVVIVTLDVDAAGADEVEQAADVARRRLDALGAEGEVGWDDSSIEVLVPVGDEALARAAMAPIGEVQFRPVLDLLDLTSAPGPAADGEAPDPSTEAIVAASTGELYRLGPAVLGGDAIEGTVVGQGGGSDWTINPTSVEGPTGIDAFNAIAAACYDAAPPCPAQTPDGRGRLAIVFDDVDLSAPAIQVRTFERDEIQISGEMHETEARALAVSVDAGVSPARWTVRG